jgi:adenosylhomocysteinase
MYHLEESSLRVCEQICSEEDFSNILKNSRLILLQHILPDTEKFIDLIKKNGAEIHTILAKPYSINPNVFQSISSKYNTVKITYEKLDDTTYLEDLLNIACNQTELDGKNIYILEVGGYFAKTLSNCNGRILNCIKGVIEVTTFGHQRYDALKEKIKLPVFSVARSPIKSIEARYVGRSAVRAVYSMFQEVGVSIAGRRALVIGFGMIGKSVASSLQNSNLLVSVYDKNEFEQLNAYTQGYETGEKRDLLAKADIVFSATATRAMNVEDFNACKNKSVIASVGSRGNEYDIQGLADNSSRITEISPMIKKYQLSRRKSIYVLRDGYAVNFYVTSCPDEIVDLIFAEMLVCMKLIENNEYTKNILNEVSTQKLNKISSDWLKHLI